MGKGGPQTRPSQEFLQAQSRGHRAGDRQPLGGQGTERAPGPTKEVREAPGGHRGQPCRVASRTGTDSSQDTASEPRQQTIRAKGLDKPPVIKVSTLFK